MFVLAGCGGGDSRDTPSPAPQGDGQDLQASLPPNVVKDDAIDRYRDGSPEQTMLEWWQAFQFRDVNLVTALTDPEVVKVIGRERLSLLIRRVGSGLQGIRILGRHREGRLASIRVALLSFTPKKGETTPPSTPTGLTPSTISLRLRDGAWVFADSSYLRDLARARGL